MRTLIGSQALRHWLPDTQPRDTDYFSDTHIPRAEYFYDERLEQYSWGDVATLNELYTIKVSHSFWNLRNGSWGKHMGDIMRMKQHGAQFLPELYDILYPIWEDLHGRKPANLNQEAEEFFNGNVQRVFEHDSIHHAIAFGERPLFEAILREGSAVAVSREKFEALPEEQKVQLVQEEVMATALERRVFAEGGQSWRPAYPQFLKNLITSYSKGWFPLWVVLNFEQVNRAPLDYYTLACGRAERLVPLEVGRSPKDLLRELRESRGTAPR